MLQTRVSDNTTLLMAPLLYREGMETQRHTCLFPLPLRALLKGLTVTHVKDTVCKGGSRRLHSFIQNVIIKKVDIGYLLQFGYHVGPIPGPTQSSEVDRQINNVTMAVIKGGTGCWKHQSSLLGNALNWKVNCLKATLLGKPKGVSTKEERCKDPFVSHCYYRGYHLIQLERLPNTLQMFLK